MSKELDLLLEKTRTVRMTQAQMEEQRRSFAFGNAKIENDDITRDTINREAEALAAENGSQD